MDLHGIDVVVFLVFVATVVGVGLYKSRGGEDSIEQKAYQIGQRVISDGGSLGQGALRAIRSAGRKSHQLRRIP